MIHRRYTTYNLQSQPKGTTVHSTYILQFKKKNYSTSDQTKLKQQMIHRRYTTYNLQSQPKGTTVHTYNQNLHIWIIGISSILVFVEHSPIIVVSGRPSLIKCSQLLPLREAFYSKMHLPHLSSRHHHNNCNTSSLNIMKINFTYLKNQQLSSSSLYNHLLNEKKKNNNNNNLF